MSSCTRIAFYLACVSFLAAFFLSNLPVQSAPDGTRLSALNIRAQSTFYLSDTAWGTLYFSATLPGNAAGIEATSVDYGSVHSSLI